MSTKPEAKLSIPRRVVMSDLEKSKTLKKCDVGFWAVFGAGEPIVCESYVQASELASSFNRCPA